MNGQVQRAVFGNDQVVFDKGTNEFVHPDGGRQKVYSNLVYSTDRVVWNTQWIDPELKQQALEHCLGFTLGPRPSSTKRASMDEREPAQSGSPVGAPDASRQGFVSQCSISENTSIDL